MKNLRPYGAVYPFGIPQLLQAEKWPEFQRRYTEELEAVPEETERFRALLQGRSVVTLLYGAKDETRNQAVVLRNYLLQGGQS